MCEARSGGAWSGNPIGAGKQRSPEVLWTKRGVFLARPKPHLGARYSVAFDVFRGAMRPWRAIALTVVSVLATAAPAAASFPGANGRIAFAGKGGIYTAAPDGSDQRLVVQGATAPSWAPDGKELAYVKRRGPLKSIHTASADGANERLISHVKRAAQETRVSFSPSGRRLLFNDGRRLVTIGSDGAGEKTISTGRYGVSRMDPQWSPDGKRIVYSDALSGIWSVRRNGTHPMRLTSGPSPEKDRFDDYPSWSPDGRRIVFLRDGSKTRKLMLMRADGSAKRPIFSKPVTYADGMPLTGGPLHPEFSPDGGRVVFVDGSGCWTLFTVSVSGGDATPIYPPCQQPVAFTPSWQPLP
jgi:Tol biopolymer transport system component